MALRDLQKGLTIDQANILAGDIVGIGSGTVQVRTRQGKTIRAVGSGYQLGDQVQLHTDGRSYTVAGAAPLSALDGESIDHV